MAGWSSWRRRLSYWFERSAIAPCLESARSGALPAPAGARDVRGWASPGANGRRFPPCGGRRNRCRRSRARLRRRASRPSDEHTQSASDGATRSGCYASRTEIAQSRARGLCVPTGPATRVDLGHDPPVLCADDTDRSASANDLLFRREVALVLDQIGRVCHLRCARTWSSIVRRCPRHRQRADEDRRAAPQGAAGAPPECARAPWTTLRIRVATEIQVDVIRPRSWMNVRG